MPGVIEELDWRGLVHQVTSPDLALELAAGPVVAYAGFDPSSDSLTLGNLLGIVTLMRLQQAGHRPIAVAGGGTGMIGDPSGKTSERTLLTTDHLEANLKAIRAQLERFLDFSPGRALLVNNADWLGSISLLEFLRDTGKHFTVNAMVAKDSVRSRLEEREQGISYTEFTYMLLQAYDYLHLFDGQGCRLQIGGSDQWGNITAGIDLIRRVRTQTVYGLTFPLVTKADGTKFGKSEAGNVWLDPAQTSPYAMYQFLVRSEDTMVGPYLRYYTFRGREEIDGLLAADPASRAAQRALASDVVALVHGEAEAERASRVSEVLFSEEIRSLDERTLVEVMADGPSTTVARSSLPRPVVDLLVETGLSASRGAARRVLTQGGAYVNNRRVSGEDAALGVEDLLHDRYAILRQGKRDQHLLLVT
jgi:tyrosyl-tRNA synthetase